MTLDEYMLKKYEEIRSALGAAEIEHNKNKRSVKNREIFQWAAAEYHLIVDILNDLKINYDDGLN